MKMLKSRLYEFELEKQQAVKDGVEKSEIGWGHQIRSYVFSAVSTSERQSKQHCVLSSE